MEYINKKLEEFNKFLDSKKSCYNRMGVSNLPLLDYFYDKTQKLQCLIKTLHQMKLWRK